MKEQNKLVSETMISNDKLDQHPNIDQIITRPYLFYYIPKDKVDQVESGGIKSDNGIEAFFTRIPKLPQYQEFLDQHVAVKISVSKLVRSSEDVRVRGINFPAQKGNELILKELELTKLSNFGDKFYKCFEKSKNLEDVPKAKIMFSDGILPPFTFKVLDEVIESVNLKDRQLLISVKRALKELDSRKNDFKSGIPVSVKNVLIKTGKMDEFRKLLPMADRLTKLSKTIDRSQFIAANAILNSILNSTNSKTELIEFIKKS